MDPLTVASGLAVAAGMKLTYDLVSSWYVAGPAEAGIVEIKLGDRIINVPEGSSAEAIDKAIKETLGDGRAA